MQPKTKESNTWAYKHKAKHEDIEQVAIYSKNVGLMFPILKDKSKRNVKVAIYDTMPFLPMAAEM